MNNAPRVQLFIKTLKQFEPLTVNFKMKFYKLHRCSTTNGGFCKNGFRWAPMDHDSMSENKHTLKYSSIGDTDGDN